MNIYIKAMEIGYNNPKGISYEKLKDLIETSLNITIQGQMEFAFLNWFLENFSAMPLFNKNLNTPLYEIHQFLNGNNGDSDRHKTTYEKYTSFEYFINGGTTKQYIDYLELSHAKKSSKSAFILSLISIMVAIGTFSYYFLNPPASPPYEVIIIDTKEEITHLDSTVILNTDKLNDTTVLNKNEPNANYNKD